MTPLVLALALLLSALPALPARAASPAGGLPPCFGPSRPLVVSSGMPYTPVRVQGMTGFFVIDLGAEVSSISLAPWSAGRAPSPQPGTRDRFAGVEFFGAMPPVRLPVRDHGRIRGTVVQAGLIGTDWLRTHVVTLDYAGGRLHRSGPHGFCSDATLRQAGFRSLSSRDYYGTDPASLRCPAAPRRSPCPNIPSIPVRIGGAEAMAQLDTGFDDGLHPPSLNINRAFLRQIRRTGLGLERQPDADLTLSTCTGAAEAVIAYRLPAGEGVELVGSDGATVSRRTDVMLFLKDTPASARSCGGIGTWNRPAAQLGASFVNTGTLVADPFSRRIWFRPQPSPSRTADSAQQGCVPYEEAPRGRGSLCR